MVEREVREASYLFVEDTLRQHRELPVPDAVEQAFRRVTKTVPGKYRLHYVDDPSFNALAAEGGDVVVNRGVYSKSQGDESTIAVVIGHELAHVVRRHAYHRMVKAAIADVALYAILRDSAANRRAFIAAFAGLFARFSRDDETEADRLGFTYAMQAGFEAAGALRAMELMRSEGQENTEFLSSHPGGRVRVEMMEKMVQAYDKGVPLEFIRYGKLDKDLEKGIGEVPTLEWLQNPSLTVWLNAPPDAYTMSVHPRFRVQCQEPGSLCVLVRAPNGKVSRLFPNQFEPSGACDAGKIFDIPSYAYRSKDGDLIRLRWEAPGSYQYLFVLTDKEVDWSARLDKTCPLGEFKDAFLNTAESQGARVLDYGNETLTVR